MRRFVVLVARVYRSADLLFHDAILGIHRPDLSEPELKGLSSNQIIAAAGQMRLTVESYLREMSVQNTLIECSLSQRIGFSGSKAILRLT